MPCKCLERAGEANYDRAFLPDLRQSELHPRIVSKENENNERGRYWRRAGKSRLILLTPHRQPIPDTTIDETGKVTLWSRNHRRLDGSSRCSTMTEKTLITVDHFGW